MCVVGIAVKQAHRYRVRLQRFDCLGHPLGFLTRQLYGDGSIRLKALAQLQSQLLGNQFVALSGLERVKVLRRTVLATDSEHITEAVRRQERDSSKLAFEQRVCGDGRSVHKKVSAAQFLKGLNHGAGGIIGSTRYLAARQPSGTQKAGVGERPTNVDRGDGFRSFSHGRAPAR